MKSKMIENLLNIINESREKEEVISIEEEKNFESKMITTMREKIEELESEKENALLYEENSAILTAPADEFFKQIGTGPTVIPLSFIFKLHHTQNTRRLYVFDFIDIARTNGEFPSNMDSENYGHFLDSVDEALSRVGFSTSMRMNQEQRKHFDKIVRTREQECPLPNNLSYSSCYRLIKRLIFGSLPDRVESYLSIKNQEELTAITKSVMNKCAGLRLNDLTIRRYIDEAIEENGYNYQELRKVDWTKIEDVRKKQLREEAKRVQSRKRTNKGY